MQATEEMLAYIQRIRNAAKKDYALRYAIWLTRAESDRDVPEPKAIGLTYMGAQSVRMALNTIQRNVSDVSGADRICDWLESLE